MIFFLNWYFVSLSFCTMIWTFVVKFTHHFCIFVNSNKKSNTLLFSHTELKCQYYREWATETDAHKKITLFICSFCTLKLKMDLGSVDRNSWKSHKTSWPADFRMALWILKLTTGFSSGHIQTETNMHTLSKTEKISILAFSLHVRDVPSERRLVWLLIRFLHASFTLDPALMSRSHSEALLLPLRSSRNLPAVPQMRRLACLTTPKTKPSALLSKAQAAEARGLRWICQGRTFSPAGIQIEPLAQGWAAVAGSLSHEL